MLKVLKKIKFRLGELKLSISVKRYLVTMFYASSAIGFAERRVTTTDGNTLSNLSPKEIKVPKNWKNLLDPQKNEFWKEGNHLPDAGFIEWATNPTIQNAKLYLIRMNTKRDRLHLMTKQQEQANKELIAAGLIANDYDFLTDQVARRKSKSASHQVKLDQNISNIWFYFHPSCSHCKRQAEILKGNSNVSPVQVGGQNLHNFKGLQKSLWAEKEDLKRYISDGQVPVLIIYNSKTNKIASLKGVQSIPKINKAAASLGSNSDKKGTRK